MASAAAVLAISGRQVNRLLLRYRDGGRGTLIPGARGRKSNNQLGAGVREYVLELVRRNYRDFGPTLAMEALQERHGVTVGRETVRKWMVEDTGMHEDEQIVSGNLVPSRLLRCAGGVTGQRFAHHQPGSYRVSKAPGDGNSLPRRLHQLQGHAGDPAQLVDRAAARYRHQGAGVIWFERSQVRGRLDSKLPEFGGRGSTDV